MSISCARTTCSRWSASNATWWTRYWCRPTTRNNNLNRPWDVQEPALIDGDTSSQVGLRPETITAYDRAGEVIETKQLIDVSQHFRTTTLEYNRLGQLYKTLEPSVTVVDASGTSTDTPTTYRYYDAAGELRFTRDPRGVLSETRYDALGQAVETIDQNPVAGQSPITTFTHHNIAGEVSSSEDTLHRVTSYLTNALGEVVTTTLPAIGGVAEIVTEIFDLLGNVVSQTDPHRDGEASADYGTTITEINGADETTDVVSSSEDTHTDHNAFGDATGETDPNAEHTTDAVDNLGRPIVVSVR